MKRVRELIEALIPIQKSILEIEQQFASVMEGVHPNYTYSALNFLRYLRLRTFDLRKIQQTLTTMGLSSISHSERHVLANIENILYLLHLLEGSHFQGKFPFGEHPVNFIQSKKALGENARRLFRSAIKKNHTHIMITLPSAATEYDQVLGLVQSGMEIARINCAHDSEVVWMQMVENIRRAEKETGNGCSIYFDLAGPKLRTVVTGTKKGKHKKKKESIRVNKGDRVEVWREVRPSRPASYNEKGELERAARISVSMPEILDWVKPGEAIWFDDGNVFGKILDVYPTHFDVVIRNCNPKGSKLRSEKGINLPDTDMALESPTEEDLKNLPFIVKHGDIVGYSYVRYPEDVARLQQKLADLNGSEMGLILKIENKDAFNQLPGLLLQAMKSPSIGVMTARGDLAVEVGPERLSEVQEEIMWLCEAAFIPNIWATQVLETLAKKGVVTRAEITDAAMAGRAECVMLNKGPYIVDALNTLANITERMGHHRQKKQGAMRKLKVVERFFEGNGLS